MVSYTVIVVNTDENCGNSVSQVFTAETCMDILVQIYSATTAQGLFDVYLESTGTTPIFSGLTLEEMISGVTIDIECVTPTPTPTPTVTPTIPPTPSITPTATPTPSPGIPYAYIFAEPQTQTDSDTLISWASSNGAVEWGSWFSVGIPNNNAGNYSNDLDVYAHQPSFINGTGNFVQPELLKAEIAQSQGQVISGITHNIHTYGSIEVSDSLVNNNIRYFYTIWLPLYGVGGSLSDMTNDVGNTLGGTNIFDGIPSITGLTALDVEVTAGACIPEGTYRVLWVSPNFELPITLPLTSSIFFRGDVKT